MSASPRLAGSARALWIDCLQRDALEDGRMARWVHAGVRGFSTSLGPFTQAVVAGSYDAAIAAAGRPARGSDARPDARVVYEAVVVRDLQDAADLLLPAYEETAAREGYVSLEVSPQLARSRDGMLAQARRLWRLIDRPNLMIKLPATSAGIEALGTLIDEGINVDATSVFSRACCRAVCEAYLSGLERRVRRRASVQWLRCAVSFFVSRVDLAVDAQLERIAERAPQKREAALALRGRVALANAALAHHDLVTRFDTTASARWRVLAEQAAQAPLLVWVSVRTKNPGWPVSRYVDALDWPHSALSLTPATWDALADDGSASTAAAAQTPAAVRSAADAAEVFAALERVGVGIDEITDRLLDDGLSAWSAAHDAALAAVAARLRAVTEGG